MYPRRSFDESLQGVITMVLFVWVYDMLIPFPAHQTVELIFYQQMTGVGPPLGPSLQRFLHWPHRGCHGGNMTVTDFEVWQIGWSQRASAAC